MNFTGYLYYFHVAMLYSRILLCNLIAVCVVVCAPLVHTHTHSHIYTGEQVHKRTLTHTKACKFTYTTIQTHITHTQSVHTLTNTHTYISALIHQNTYRYTHWHTNYWTHTYVKFSKAQCSSHVHIHTYTHCIQKNSVKCFYV